MLRSLSLRSSVPRLCPLPTQRSYFMFTQIKRNEGKKNYKAVLAERDIKPMEREELQEEVERVFATDMTKIGTLNPAEFLDESPLEASFQEEMKDPLKAHVVDMLSHQEKFARAQDFGSFTNRTRVAIQSFTLGEDHEDAALIDRLPVPAATMSPLLDRYEFLEEKKDESLIDVKIQANLYEELEIVEDESTEYSPTLSQDYNDSNYFHAMGKQTPEFVQKREATKAAQDGISSFDSARIDTACSEEHELYARHLMDKEGLETLHKRNTKAKNLVGRDKTPFDDTPSEYYEHYEDLVNDMMAKLLPEDGLLRLEPGWKWNVMENGHKNHGFSPLYVKPTSQFHFPEGMMVMKVGKYKKVNDKYLCPVQAFDELKKTSTKAFFMKKYYKQEQSQSTSDKIDYLLDGTATRFLLINLRFGTFSVATYEGSPDPNAFEWNPDIEAHKHRALTNGQILEKTKSDFDYADMTVYRIPPSWILALKTMPFPVFAGTGLTGPERALHARMHILGRMQNDDSNMRSDMSEFAQALPYRVEASHEMYYEAHGAHNYEQFSDLQQT